MKDFRKYEALVWEINPFVFQRYLESSGWHQFLQDRKDVLIYQYRYHNYRRIEQADIPTDRTFWDYAPVMYMAVQNAAHLEKRPVSQLLQTLLWPQADILWIRFHETNRAPGMPLPG